MITMVIKNLGTGPTWSGITHRPEIIRGRNADNTAVIKSGNLAPQASRLLIFRIYCDQQFACIKAKFLCNKLPCLRDCLFLEVIAKAEITKHLEKSMMPSCIADIFKIIMLAAGTHTFLGCHGSGIVSALKTGKDIFELHHA